MFTNGEMLLEVPETAWYSGYTTREYVGTHEWGKLAIPHKEGSSDFVEGRDKQQRWARHSKVGVRENPRQVTSREESWALEGENW